MRPRIWNTTARQPTGSSTPNAPETSSWRWRYTISISATGRSAAGLRKRPVSAEPDLEERSAGPDQHGRLHAQLRVRQRSEDILHTEVLPSHRAAGGRPVYERLRHEGRRQPGYGKFYPLERGKQPVVLSDAGAGRRCSPHRSILQCDPNWRRNRLRIQNRRHGRAHSNHGPRSYLHRQIDDLAGSRRPGLTPHTRRVKFERDNRRCRFIGRLQQPRPRWLAICWYLWPLSRLRADCTANINGYVRDSSGAIVPNATRHREDDGTASRQNRGDQRGGFYQLLALPSGTYERYFQTSGFQQQTQTGLAIDREPEPARRCDNAGRHGGDAGRCCSNRAAGGTTSADDVRPDRRPPRGRLAAERAECHRTRANTARGI